MRQSNNRGARDISEADFSPVDSGISHSAAAHQQASSTNQTSSMHTLEEKVSSDQMIASHEVSSQQTSSISEQQSYSSSTSYTTQKTSRAMVPGWSDSPVMDSQKEKEELLKKIGAPYGVDTALDQLIAETESLVSNDSLLIHQEEKRSEKVQQSSSSMTTQMTSMAMATDSFSSSMNTQNVVESPAEECRRSFEEAELEALATETHSNTSFSKQSSIVETASVQSFVYQKEEKSESESSFQSRRPLKSASSAFIRTPETFTHTQPPSCPTTPMSQRRRLRINQSPKPLDEQEAKPKYRDGTSSSPFQPGFYRPPPEETSSTNPIFKLIRRNNSRTNLAAVGAEGTNQPEVRVSQASSKAYEGDSES